MPQLTAQSARTRHSSFVAGHRFQPEASKQCVGKPQAVARMKQNGRLQAQAQQAETATTSAAYYKERLLANFEERSKKYDDGNTLHPPLCAELLRRASLQPGQTVFDGACGTGFLSIEAAQRVAPGGRVLGVDMSPGMLGKAKAKAQQLGLRNIEFLEGDLETIDLPEGKFDLVLVSAAIPYLSDIPAAITRFRSWLKPGGRFVCNTPQTPGVPALEPFREIVQEQLGIAVPDPAEPTGSSELLTAVLEQAGFSMIEVSSTPEEAVLKDATPQQYAERNFQSCLKFPWTTLGPAEMKQVAEHEASIRAEYLKRATKIGEGLVRGNDVVSTYTMQWADAVNLS